MSGVKRILRNLLVCIEERDFYQSHQIIRTLSTRYLAKNMIVDTVGLLFHGAEFLLLHDINEGGSDLSLLMAHVLYEHKVTFDAEILKKITTLLVIADDQCPERDEYISACLKYTKLVDEEYIKAHGDTESSPSKQLHLEFATLLYDERHYDKARWHFMRANDGEAFAKMLIDTHLAHGLPFEVDLFIIQAVLQLLIMNSLKVARETYNYYVNNHPHAKQINWPLINFGNMLLCSIERKSLENFKILVNKYQGHLKIDPLYSRYIERIGEIHMGLAKPKSSNFIGSFISTMLSGDDSQKTQSGEGDRSTKINGPQSTSVQSQKKLQDMDLD